MFQANLLVSFSGKCVLTASHLINRTPSPLLTIKLLLKYYLAVYHLILQSRRLGVYVLLTIKKPKEINFLVIVKSTCLWVTR